MSKTNISVAKRQRIAFAAKHRCGYCQTQEMIIGMPLHIEHIIPSAAGGSSQEENLWLACPRCNQYKGERTHGIDQQTALRLPLFNPRTQKWEEHFTWQQNGRQIVGLTPTGRATVAALQMNNFFVVRSRKVWIESGWHPPKD